MIESIRRHIAEAVAHAEAGYSAAQEEEDTITGELGGALRTKQPHLVQVSSGQPPGTWRWSISYTKFGSKGAEATESVTGADGILKIRVGAAEQDQRKTALFQAKNAASRASGLIEQCAKMSVWREAAFVIEYTDSGYFAALERPDHVLIHPPARQEPVPLEIGRVVPLFSDDDDAVHGDVRSAERYGLTYGLVDRYLFSFAYLLAQ